MGIGFRSNCIGEPLGFGGGNLSAGRIQVELKPRAERALSADQIIDELRPKLRAVPGLRVFLQNPPVINLVGDVPAGKRRACKTRLSSSTVASETSSVFRSATAVRMDLSTSSSVSGGCVLPTASLV